MKKIEAKSLEEAYRIACDLYDCSISELRYEIVQYPSTGIMGLFAKPAIIVADRKASPPSDVLAKESEIPYGQDPSTTRAEEKEELSPSPESSDSDKSRKTESEGSHEEIIERFFNGEERLEEGGSVDTELQSVIERQLRELIEKSCFDIDVVEVDVIDDTAYIFLDGEDAALIIGKEGYRYNALSYLLFNWIHSRYKLFIKLEIAQFLSSQQEMIRHYIQPVIEHVEREGWGRTRPLDGILVQIALEQLREAFPNKYVAIKRQRDGSRYVLINEFNNRRR